jgi:NAD(P)-dependent dehydrogenase (short-subunit alcohol dehydrogenase family)
MPISYDFTHKVVLVTGAATGIGKTTALSFARAGASVVVADLDAERGMATAQEIEGLGRDALFEAADLTDEVAVDRLFDKIEARFGRLDCAHNNVGFGFGHGLLETSLVDWERSLKLCLTAPFLCLKREIPMMRRGGGGTIVNTASMAAVRYAKLASAGYTAAKAGILSLTRYAATAHAADNIRVNSVSPGLVSTEAVAQFLTPEEQVSYAGQSQPIARPSTTQDIADSVLWLCSEASAMVTGENICVAGGQQAL